MAANNTIIKMDGGQTAQDSAATIDVPDDGLLMGCKLIIAASGFGTGGLYMRAELSFASTNAFDSNDTRATFNYIHVESDDIQTAENSVAHHESNMIFPDGIRVFAGERLHLHTQVTTVSQREAIAILVFRFKTFTARRR